MRDFDFEEGWRDWQYTPPPRGFLIQAIRKEWSSPNTLFPEELNSECNVARLYWRFTGIARERWDRLPVEMREQLMSSGGSGQFANALLSNISRGWLSNGYLCGMGQQLNSMGTE